MIRNSVLAAVSPLTLLAASCSHAATGDSAGEMAGQQKLAGLRIQDMATFDEPWAMAFLPGGDSALVTEKSGKLIWWDNSGRKIEVLGVPKVDYGGQGGFGDVALAPGFAEAKTIGDGGTIYLSWVEAGPNDTRGAVVGTAFFDAGHLQPRLQDLKVIWRQFPKTTGRGQYGHRITFSPDGRYLYVSSGERQKKTPAQDLSSNLGKIVRLNIDGSPADGNPFADSGDVTAQVWSLGHRNPLGLKFGPKGQLWEVEHGPRGGDELNLIEPGRNYGWPLVSNGDNYDGTPIPHHATRPDLTAPVISWTPVIGPGDMTFLSSAKFPAWHGNALIAGLVCHCLVRVAIDGETAHEVERIPMGARIREVVQGPDGAIWVLEDGEAARLRRIMPNPSP